MTLSQQLLLHAVHAHQTDRLAEADRLYRATLAIDPASGDGLHLLGLVEKRQNKVASAVTLMRRSLHVSPHLLTARQNLYRTLKSCGDHTRMLLVLKQLLAIDPADDEALFQLGGLLLQLERRAEAAAPLQAAIRLRPEHAESRIGFSEARLLDINSQAPEFERALLHARTAVTLRPDLAVAHLQIALVLEEMAHAHQSLTSCRRALRLDPNITDARHVAGINRMRLGDFVGGMAEFEYRKNNLWYLTEPTSVPPWDGRPKPDGAVILTAEGGWGDMIHFVRFVPQVARICGEVVVVCPSRLRRLLSTVPSPGNIRFNPPQLPAAEGRAMFLSLPHLLGSTADSVPNRPYLSADPERVRLWTERLAGLSGLRVGLCWSNGDATRAADPKRSVPFDLVRPLTTIPGVSLVNLHKQDNAAKSLAHADEALLHRLGPDLDAGPDAFLDTAAVMKTLDLVIAIDSAVLHVAGALGVPTWLPAPYRMDWRWMNDDERSIWYPSLRIYRQDHQWDWSAPMARIARDLARAAEAKAAGRIPDLLPAG